ncbi:efflux RND transporter periplasmic adaptor subunit [Aliisedimentitalea scapharcae]|uniref:Efflux RND transporter periplasmic adaptor subunit n=1 Tax=Aliisedimentitalea scapharcae TaxID=1524259 RepID=A0ABZ2XTC5_9RHOB
MLKLGFAIMMGVLIPTVISAQEALTPVMVTEWKAVFAKVEPRDTVPARARIGGTLIELTVEEGDQVERGQVLARIHDEKLALQLQAVEAQIAALLSQLGNAKTELTRGEGLLERGVTTAQRLDALRTQVAVLVSQIDAQQAQKQVVEQQVAEGSVFAPVAGRVLDVPVTSGGVVMPGEPVAVLAGGGLFLRLAVPERHRVDLKEGATIRVGSGTVQEGHLAKVYPQIENGRVIADVDVPEFDADFVNARVLVHLPVGQRAALLVPSDAVSSRMGLDFVTVQHDGGQVERAVVLGEIVDERTEVLSGLSAGDLVVISHE